MRPADSRGGLHIWGWGVLTTVLEYWSNAALWLAYQTVNKYLACVFTSTEYVSKSFTSTPHLTLTVIFFEITTFSLYMCLLLTDLSEGLHFFHV